MANMHLAEPPDFTYLTPESVTRYFVQKGVYKLFEYKADISENDSEKLVNMVAFSDALAKANIKPLNFSRDILKNILEYQIIEVSVPPSAISKVDIAKTYESVWPVAIQTATPGTFSIRFKCDKELTEWVMLQRWKSFSANRYGPRFLNEYALGLSIFALKPENLGYLGAVNATAISRIDAYDVFPLSITNPNFKQDAEDGAEGWFETTVSFACSHIRINGLT